MVHGATKSASRRAERAARRPPLARAGIALFAAGIYVVALGTTVHADARTEARRHFRRGMELLQAGHVDAGVGELVRAYDALPHPNVLYNIGRAYAEAGRHEEGLAYFEQYLATDPPDREEVVAFIEALRVRLDASNGVVAEPAGPAEVSPEPSAALRATPTDLAALRDSATQIEALAEATDSEALRDRARTLRAMADALEAAPTTDRPSR